MSQRRRISHSARGATWPRELRLTVTAGVLVGGMLGFGVLVGGCGKSPSAGCMRDDDCASELPCTVGHCLADGTCESVPADLDGDGYAALCGGGDDCDDTDLAISPAAAEDCLDGVDNDCDGATDCGDPACAQHPACCLVSEQQCTDGRDEDCDGLTDCDDPDCSGDPGCCAGEEICNDGLDNNCDGRVDCLDADCVTHVLCTVPYEWCDDGLDNDGDGLTDCEDDDCGGAIACGGFPLLSCGDEVCVPGWEPLICGYNYTSGYHQGSAYVSRYSCGGPLQLGKEQIFYFQGPASSPTVVYMQMNGQHIMTPESLVNIDLYVLDGGAATDPETVCDPGHCVAMANSGSEGLESIAWVAMPGRIYCVVADTPTDSAFAIEMTTDIECDACAPTEQCDNLQDDDCDGLTDCDDPDCACP